MSEYTLPFTSEQCRKDRVDLLGGKCASLGELNQVGARVPLGFAVTTAFYDDFLDKTALDTVIEERFCGNDFSEVADAKAASEDIQQHIKATEFPAELSAEIDKAWEKLKMECAEDAADLSVAVRSSATAEDLPDASFAGQQDTYLGVRSLDAVKRRIRDCIASLFTARAISYREETEFDHTEVKISVGIQRMVDARSSGVMFTLNPANGDRSKVRIEATWGLGEPVVSGQVTPDSFLVEKPMGNVVERDITEKSMMEQLTENGVAEVEVGAEMRDTPSVTDEELVELTEWGKKLEQYFDVPQDIEWAIEEDKDETRIYILQSRPETAWAEPNQDDSKQVDASTLSDNSTAEFILENVSDSS